MFESEHLTGKPPCYIHTSINLTYYELISALSPLVTEIQPFQKEWLIKMWYEWKKISHLSMGNYRTKFSCVSLVQSIVLHLFDHHLSSFTREAKAVEHLMSIRLIRLRSLLVLNNFFFFFWWHLDSSTEFGSPPGSGSCLEQEMK